MIGVLPFPLMLCGVPIPIIPLIKKICAVSSTPLCLCHTLLCLGFCNLQDKATECFLLCILHSVEHSLIINLAQLVYLSVALPAELVLLICDYDFQKETRSTQNNCVSIVITCKSIIGIVFFNLSKSIYIKKGRNKLGSTPVSNSIFQVNFGLSYET